MRKFFYILQITLAIFIPAFFSGCVEALVEPDTKAPVITITKPKTNDTMFVGTNIIKYTASDDKALTYFELYVNSKFIAHYNIKTDGTIPEISVTVDSTQIGKRIQYYIKAYDGTNGTASDTIKNILIRPNIKPPKAPGNLKFIYFSNDKSMLNLTWIDSSNNETSFELWRKETGGVYEKIQILPANTVSTNDVGLIDTVNYTYKVRALNSYGYSESNEVSTGRIDPNKPLAPTDLTAQPLGTKKVRLHWTNNAVTALGIKIERKVKSGTVYQQIAFIGIDKSAYDDESLSPVSSYSYRIKVIGQFGESDYSNVVDVTTLTNDFLAPGDLKASYDSKTRKIELTWMDNSVFEVETRIERRIGLTGDFAEIGKVSTDVVKYSDTVSTTGYTYYYRVRAYTTVINNISYTDYSNVVSVVIPAAAKKRR